MIFVEVHGHIAEKNKVTEYCLDIIHHFFKKGLKRDVDIIVNVVHTLNQELGNASGDRNEVLIDLGHYEQYRKDGKLKKTKISRKDMLITLAHELVHAKQFIRGEQSPNGFTWRKGKHVQDCTEMTYEEYPWEVEAYGLQEELYKLYWEDKYARKAD